MLRNVALLAFTVATCVSAWVSFADEGHAHGAKAPPSDAGMMHEGHGHQGKAAHHRHDRWIEPPEAYAHKTSDVWADADAIERGEEIYQRQCVACHGVDGQGTGPMAEMLSHPPADLTNNFHSAPGNGDAYLFWRVSEGGQVEPFKSQNSKMPAFKQILSESERWDVLSYVHTFFHQGLMEWSESRPGDKASASKADDS